VNTCWLRPSRVVALSTLVALLAGVVACSSSGSPSGSPPLRNGDEVESSRASDATSKGAIGQPATLGNVTLIVKQVKVGGNESGP
jgi:hypothetical protein